jgi:hypothetical protein
MCIPICGGWVLSIIVSIIGAQMGKRKAISNNHWTCQQFASSVFIRWCTCRERNISNLFFRAKTSIFVQNLAWTWRKKKDTHNLEL